MVTATFGLATVAIFGCLVVGFARSPLCGMIATFFDLGCLHFFILQVVAAENGFGRGNFSLFWRVLDPEADVVQRCRHHRAVGGFGDRQCDAEMNTRFCDWDGVRIRATIDMTRKIKQSLMRMNEAQLLCNIGLYFHPRDASPG